MRRSSLPLLALALLLVVAAGCGQTTAKPFLPGPTAACLRGAGFRAATGDTVPLVAATAANGGLLATPTAGGNSLMIGFADDPSDAKGLERAFRRVAPPALLPHISDVMSSKRNAVLFWTVSPTPEQQQTVLGCLRS